MATYDYADEDGEVLFVKERLEPKTFRQRLPTGEYRLENVRRVLYRLPHISGAGPESFVFLCEGEKDADRLAELGLISTTNPEGAGKWRDEYTDLLRGRHVVILPDHDDPGRAHAAMVAAQLHGVAASVRVLALPGLPRKGDVSDWLGAGGCEDHLIGMAEACTLWTPPAVGDVLDDPPAAPPPGPRPFPLLDDAAYHGVVGDAVRVIAPHSEAEPAALLIRLLSAVGAMIGRGPHVPIDGVDHAARLWPILVGDSSVGRKGQSWSSVRRLLDLADPDFRGRIVGGLTTGQGLVHAIRDPVRGRATSNTDLT